MPQNSVSKPKHYGGFLMDLVQELAGLGFTEYEARIYLALLQESPASGYQLSKRSGVPRSMAYETLGRLDARGVVLQSNDGSTTRYRPLPPEALLERERSQHNQRIETLSRGLGRLYQAAEGDQLWSIAGREAVLAYARGQLESARNELMLVLNDDALVELSPAIEAACENDVRVRALLTGEKMLNCGEAAHHPPLESELQELNDSLVVVVDGREVLIAGGGPQFAATITNNRDLVLIARQFVWMELFAQRVYSSLDEEALQALVADRSQGRVNARKN
jgi:sugar-specific transcriptional regulator TrmB